MKQLIAGCQAGEIVSEVDFFSIISANLREFIKELGGKEEDFRELASSAGKQSLEKIVRVIFDEQRAMQLVSSWHEQDGIIYLNLPPIDDTIDSNLFEYLEKEGVKMGGFGKRILNQADTHCKEGALSKLAILKGEYFTDSNRTTKNISIQGEFLGMKKPNLRDACRVRKYFTEEDIQKMGIDWIIIMHEPFKYEEEYPILLGTGQRDKVPWLYPIYDIPDSILDVGGGFAFSIGE
jgi:hypothetical protein